MSVDTLILLHEMVVVILSLQERKIFSLYLLNPTLQGLLERVKLTDLNDRVKYVPVLHFFHAIEIEN